LVPLQEKRLKKVTRKKSPLKTRLSKPIQFLKPMEMLRLSEMIILLDLESSSEYGSTTWERWLVEILTYQSPCERYHVFYSMIAHEVALHESCLLSDNIYDDPFMSMGKVKVDSIDDAEELQIIDASFDILGFSHDEKYDVYRVSSFCMHMSRLMFQGMGEVASANNLDAGESLNQMCNFADSREAIADAFINPKYKVGPTLPSYDLLFNVYF
jgi:hypothetical protein